MNIRTLSNGATYCTGQNGEQLCTGSQMGRRSSHPENKSETVKLYLRRLRWVDGDYDEQGAYWGHMPGTHIYWANGETETDVVETFVRAYDREEAKAKVLAEIPAGKFFR